MIMQTYAASLTLPPLFMLVTRVCISQDNIKAGYRREILGQLLEEHSGGLKPDREHSRLCPNIVRLSLGHPKAAGNASSESVDLTPPVYDQHVEVGD